MSGNIFKNVNYVNEQSFFLYFYINSEMCLFLVSDPCLETIIVLVYVWKYF